jgi:uncharacterized protein (UPF0332 family)
MVDWNEMANDSYAAAGLLMREQHERSGISRAYYAAYSRVTKTLTLLAGVTFPTDWDGPTHMRLPELVENHLTALGRNRWQVSDYLRILYGLRIAADYKTSIDLDTTDAKKALVLMGHIFRLTKGVV